MKRLTVLILAMVMLGLLVSGCVQKHCYFMPPLNTMVSADVGSPMIVRKDCYGRVTVDSCNISTLTYLGSTGTYIRIGQRLSKYGQIVELTFPMDTKVIEIQGTKFEVIKNGDTLIGFKLTDISTTDCDKVIQGIK